MGRKDAVTKRFCSDRVRFADLVNGVYFNGRNVIHSEDLTEGSESYIQSEELLGQEEKRQFRERVRDIKMLHRHGSTIRILAIEHQSYIDYGMPVRCMEYDAMEYRKQMEELKTQNLQEKRLSTAHERLCGMRKADRLWPTYTLCLYLGEEPWDGPRSLQDMMDFGEEAGDMKELFVDYPFRLYCVNEETDFSMFHTQLRCVFELLPLRKDKNRLLEKLTADEAYTHMDEESLEFLSVVMDNPTIWKNRHKFKKSVKETEDTGKKEQEEYDMCQAIRELIEDGKQEGLSEGIKVGRSEGIKEGRMQILIDMVKEGLLKIEDAALRCGLSVEEFGGQM